MLESYFLELQELLSYHYSIWFRKTLLSENAIIIRFGKWQILYGACYACAVKEIIFVTEDDFFVCKNKKALYDYGVS